MTLSNCSKCKYLDRNPHHRSDIVCGLNPAYAAAWERLKPLDEVSKSCLPIDDCRDFELDPLLEEKAIALSLNFFDWQKLARETSDPTIAQALEETIIELNLSVTTEDWQKIANFTTVPVVRVALASEGIEAKRDAWVHVDSSCINAIAYEESDSKLKIQFNRGDIYEYDGVPREVFLSLLYTSSHGEFFNQHIKDCYRYRLI